MSRWFICLCVGLVVCRTVVAQEPTVAVAGLEPAPLPVVQPTRVEALPANGDSTGWIATHLLVGQQLGFRGQVSFLAQSSWTFVAEGFYGALLTRFGAAEAAGFGCRAIRCRASADGHNALLLGPGINVFSQFHDDGALLLAPSLEMSWLHGFGGGGGWEIGLSAGVGIGLAGEDNSGDPAAGRVTPLFSVFSGFRF